MKYIKIKTKTTVHAIKHNMEETGGKSRHQHSEQQPTTGMKGHWTKDNRTKEKQLQNKNRTCQQVEMNHLTPDDKRKWCMIMWDKCKLPGNSKTNTRLWSWNVTLVTHFSYSKPNRHIDPHTEDAEFCALRTRTQTSLGVIILILHTYM